MTCPSHVTHSMYADGALPAREAAALERHAATCAACTARIEALYRESTVLRLALRDVDDALPIPRFAPPARARDFVVLVLGIVLIGGFSSAFWSTVAAAIPRELGWLDPLGSATLFEASVDVLSFIVYEGSAMWTATLNFLGLALVVAFAGWIAVSAKRPRTFAGMAAALVAVAIALPSIGHAFEIRRNQDGDVTVAANETIDDTLLAAGQTVTIDGTVNGDLLAFGRLVTVRGNVTGNLVTGAQRVTIEGTVGGSVLGAGENVTLENARVGGNLYGFGNGVEVASGANVAGNAIAGGETVEIDGRVGVDLRGFGSRVNVTGAVEGDVDARAQTITLSPTSRVGGNVTVHVDSMDDLVVQDATIGGNVDVQITEREQRRNEYETFGFYFRQIVRVGAMFLAGLLLFAAFPVLRDVTLPDATAVVRSGAIGLAAAVTMPVAGVLLCLTVIGIPLGLLTFVLGAIGLYFSKIVMARIIGRAVLRGPQPPHYAMSLIVGLLIIVVAINLPWFGGIANFVLTLVGFGIIVSLLLARFSNNRAAA